MTKATYKALIEYTRRVLACALLMLCVMPVSDAEAATRTLSEKMWTTTGFCLADTPSMQDPVEVMTPDARSYQMSIELRTLREMLRAQSSDVEISTQASLAPQAPCEVAQDAALCPQPEPSIEYNEPTPHFVAASLLEDIAPLDAPDQPRSCNASSSGPDRCESYPAHPHRLHLDVTFSGAVLPRALAPSVRPDTKTRTLPLVRALPRHLLSAACGHTLDDERPPQAV